MLQYTNKSFYRRLQAGNKWYLEEMVVTINDQQCYLWRAVGSDGNMFDILMQSRKDTKAAKKFFRKLLKKQGFAPRVIVTDKQPLA